MPRARELTVVRAAFEELSRRGVTTRQAAERANMTFDCARGWRCEAPSAVRRFESFLRANGLALQVVAADLEAKRVA